MKRSTIGAAALLLAGCGPDRSGTFESDSGETGSYSVDASGEEVTATAEDADAALAEALTRLPPGEAAAEVSKALGLSRRDLYRRAMELKR